MDLALSDASPPFPITFIAVVALWASAALLVRWPRLRGTTLVAVWAWSLVALGAIALSEILIGSAAESPSANWSLPLRFGAAMGTFCPIMAMLGAKRPQDRAWQFIVLSLWGILSLPAFEWLLFTGVREIHPARFWFLIVLVGIGALNGLATRGWFSGLLYGLGQLALIAPFFPQAQTWLSADRGAGLGLALLSAAWTSQAVPRRPRSGGTALDRVWLDFRDAFGVVWSLRVAERMNASASMYHWPVTLHWQGFVPRESAADTIEIPAAVEESLRSLLRRFVSPAWIDARLGPPGEHLATARGEPLQA
jgi:hypothetical protein